MKLLAFLLLSFSATASAEWLKIDGVADTSSERFIDTASIRQSGPMNTMRRVIEISNSSKGVSLETGSVKSHVEYDCKDRRVRVLEENSFSEHWAQGESLAGLAPDAKSRDWSAIDKGSVSEIVFKRVCPNEGS